MARPDLDNADSAEWSCRSTGQLSKPQSMCPSRFRQATTSHLMFFPPDEGIFFGKKTKGPEGPLLDTERLSRRETRPRCRVFASKLDSTRHGQPKGKHQAKRSTDDLAQHQRHDEGGLEVCDERE